MKYKIKQEPIMSEEENYENDLNNTQNNDSSDDSDYESYYENRNRIIYESLINQCKKYIKLIYVKTCKGSLNNLSFTINDDHDEILYTFCCCSNYFYTTSYDINTDIDYKDICIYCIYKLKIFIKKIIENNIIDEDIYNNTLFRCNMIITNKKTSRTCSRYIDKPDSYCTQHMKSLQNVFIEKTPFYKNIYNMIIDKI